MAKLTLKQESFCIAYIECGNASEAYRQCYNAKRMKAETINRNAKTLMDNSKIAARIAELRAPVVKRAQITLASHLNELQKLRDMAADSSNYGAAITAEVNRGKASGLYVDKKEHAFLGEDGLPKDMNMTIEFVKPKK